MDYLPSKKFVRPVLIILAVILTGYFARFILNSKITSIPTGKNTLDSAIRTKALADAVADSDNDGLKNWEETLWRTNLLKADTDGDGTSDGDETKSGRDPLVIGKEKNSPSSGEWTDELKKPEAITMQYGTTTMTLNATQQLAADLGNSYFALKGMVGGQPLTDRTKQGLATSVAKEVQMGVAAYPDIYTEKDLKISQFAGVRTYLTNLSDAFETIFKDVSEKETPLVLSMAKANDFSDSSKLDVNIKAYQKMEEYLKKMEVPSAYAKMHLSILNSMHTTAIAVDIFKHTKEDPLRTLVAAQLYYKEVARAQVFLMDLKKQTLADGIDFSDGQQGTFFIKYFVKPQS